MEFGNWALTEDSSEAYRATYVLLVSAILLPVILFARRGCMTVALVLLALVPAPRRDRPSLASRESLNPACRTAQVAATAVAFSSFDAPLERTRVDDEGAAAEL